MNIWTLGDAVVDLLPLENMQYEACAGGAPVNVAVGVALLGQPSGFIGRVGKDALGYFLRDAMAAAGVNTQQMEFDPEYRTSTVLVSLAEQGERHFEFLVNPSADQFLSPAALPGLGRDILHCCSLALVATECRQTLEQAVTQLRDAHGVLSFDINLRSQVWADKGEMLTRIDQLARQSDILKMSEEELHWLTRSRDMGEALQRLATYPARLKIITQGAEGALVLWQDRGLAFSSYQVESIDTTGAGDAFMAGLLAAIAAHGWPEHDTELCALMAQASACGALATTRKGALKALPDKEALHAFINSQQAISFKPQTAPEK
ncbi:aminoimidazole riboside kinase [Aeromonas hydrophila]|uniref:aminoimidazole riboside kinase n=1 Tax=Aeromonas hydrophila TaxID=644 RepID=UPI0038CFE903